MDLSAALKLSPPERRDVAPCFRVSRNPVLTTFLRYDCRWCGEGFHIQDSDKTRHSARTLLAHARWHADQEDR